MLWGWNLVLYAVQTQATDCTSPYLEMMKMLSSNVNTKLGFFGVRPGTIVQISFTIPYIKMLMPDKTFDTKIADF